MAGDPSETASDSTAQVIFPPVPPPIDPDSPVRGLAAWLNFFGFQLLGYHARRDQLLACVLSKNHELEWNGVEARDLMEDIESRLKVETDKERRAQLRRDVAEVREQLPSRRRIRDALRAAMKPLLPQFDAEIRAIEKVVNGLTPCVQGIHVHLSALPQGDPAKWESELHRLLLEARDLVWTDSLRVYHVGDADSFASETDELWNAVKRLATRLVLKRDDLASVALPGQTGTNAGQGAGQDTPRLTRAVGLAAQSYSEAERKEWQNPPTDREVYDYLHEKGCKAYEDTRMPKYDTWVRTLRRWREMTGLQKNTPRAGRTGHSIITAREASAARRSPT
jgi:hypothetical protein